MKAAAASVDQLYAENLKLGWTFEGPPREVTLERFKLFADITGDDHPIHYDSEFAKHTRFGQPLAHGLLLIGMTALGSTSTSNLLCDSMIALVRQECRFLTPVFVGDIVWSRFELRSVEPRPKGDAARVTFAVKLMKRPDITVLDGLQSYHIRYRSA